MEFDPEMTLITGANQLGKSRILKSIFYALGAEVNFGPKWAAVQAKVILYVNFNARECIFFRDDSLVSIIDSETKELIFKSRKITMELGPYLAKIFNFNLKLIQSSSKIRATPTPAFIYLPYYIDQEQGWINLFSSFTKLAQYSDWKRDFIDYHTGLRGSDYYSAKSESENFSRKIDELNKELIVSETMREKLLSEISNVGELIDMEKFKEEMTFMLIEINVLNTKAGKVKIDLAKLNEELLDIDQQRLIVAASLNELTADYKHLLGSPEKVECPTCGQMHEQDFMQRFSIARDEERCVDLLAELDFDRSKINMKLEDGQGDYVKLIETSKRIQARMEIKKDNISLEDLVEARCDRRVAEILLKQISQLNDSIAKFEIEKKKIQKTIASFIDPARLEQISSFMKDRISSHCISMSVASIPDASYRGLMVNAPTDGSETPRAILACFYGYLETINKYGNSIKLPIVIDSPLQQEQDDENVLGILKFLSNNPIPNHQIVIGTVSDCGVKFPGKRVHIEGEKYQLLKREIFEACQSEIDEISLIAIGNTSR